MELKDCKIAWFTEGCWAAGIYGGMPMVSFALVVMDGLHTALQLCVFLSQTGAGCVNRYIQPMWYAIGHDVVRRIDCVCAMA